MRCHRSKGVLIPGCLGTAHGMGSGLTDQQILNGYCTCPPPRTPRHIKKDIADAEGLLAELREELRTYKPEDPMG